MRYEDSPLHEVKATRERSGRGGAGVPPAVFLPQGGALTIRSRRLPHWEVERGVYFVTFRLADSLPSAALKEIELKRGDILNSAAQAGRDLTTVEERKLRQLHARRIENTLDRGAGACFLRNPEVAEVISSALQQFDGSRTRSFSSNGLDNAGRRAPFLEVFFVESSKQGSTPQGRILAEGIL